MHVPVDLPIGVPWVTQGEVICPSPQLAVKPLDEDRHRHFATAGSHLPDVASQPLYRVGGREQVQILLRAALSVPVVAEGIAQKVQAVLPKVKDTGFVPVQGQS